MSRPVLSRGLYLDLIAVGPGTSWSGPLTWPCNYFIARDPPTDLQSSPSHHIWTSSALLVWAACGVVHFSERSWIWLLTVILGSQVAFPHGASCFLTSSKKKSWKRCVNFLWWNLMIIKRRSKKDYFFRHWENRQLEKQSSRNMHTSHGAEFLLC